MSPNQQWAPGGIFYSLYSGPSDTRDLSAFPRKVHSSCLKQEITFKNKFCDKERKENNNNVFVQLRTVFVFQYMVESKSNHLYLWTHKITITKLKEEKWERGGFTSTCSFSDTVAFVLFVFLWCFEFFRLKIKSFIHLFMHTVHHVSRNMYQMSFTTVKVMH